MSDYKERANSLREHADLIEKSGAEVYGPSAARLLVYDLRNAAAAIEALQGEVKRLEDEVRLWKNARDLERYGIDSDELISFEPPQEVQE